MNLKMSQIGIYETSKFSCNKKPSLLLFISYEIQKHINLKLPSMYNILVNGNLHF